MLKLTYTQDMADRLFFTSDQHLLHRNILKYSKRPFSSLEEMHDELVARWNAKVPQDGVVINLGDVSLGSAPDTLKLLQRFNGVQHLVVGNHEKTVMESKPCRDFFASVSHYAQVHLEDAQANRDRQSVYMSHFPFEVWDRMHFGTWHLHGHTHNMLHTPDTSKRLDVGVDNPVCDFAPLSYSEVKAIMDRRTNPVLPNDR